MPEETKEILMKLKDAVAILVLSVIVVVFLVVTKIVPIVQSIMDMNEQYAAQTLVLADKQRELDELKAAAKKQDDMSGIEKDFFVSDEPGLDAEGLIFLKALYQHEHFLDICKVEVEPYEKDKSILMIKFSMKLYAKK